jgi:hypothetical protein
MSIITTSGMVTDKLCWPVATCPVAGERHQTKAMKRDAIFFEKVNLGYLYFSVQERLRRFG